MLEKPEIALDQLKEVPHHQRRQIVSGMRWTVWLSAVSIPFSYGTTVLLARTSPEAIGTYGLLSVYIGAVLGLFYLGGDAVAIKFIPELDPEHRLSFLVSYFTIVCLAVLPWLAAAAIWPQLLHYVFGEQTSESLGMLLLILSPVCILASLTGAALKGMLEISWAQIMARLVTIGSFLVYATLFVLSRELLARSYAKVIWGTYLIVCVFAATLGLQRLLRLNGGSRVLRSLKFFLPAGFWHYTLSLQQLSAVSFFTQRLDAILILNFGNLTLLGEYVAILVLADSIRIISRLFLDTLLPSLTNMVAARNLAAASGVFSAHMRILFLANAASTYGLILLARPVTAILGAKYAGLGSLVILLALFVGLSTPGSVGGIVLSSIGKQQRAVGVAVGQVAIYATLFAFLWPRWQMEGAVIAYGIAWVLSNFVLLVIGRLSSPFPFSVTREYVVFGLTAIAAALIAKLAPLGLGAGSIAWIAALGLFLWMAGYSIKECTALIQWFSPLSSIRSQ